MKENLITIETTINAGVEVVWEKFTNPNDVMNWNNANDDWHTPKATNDLQVGGKFNYTMAAKDGSFSFDFWGIYDNIILHETIAYTLGDGRKVSVSFTKNNDVTIVSETFEAESENPIELQQQGWQAILNNFKNCVEKQNN